MIEPETVKPAPDTMWPHMKGKNVFTVEIGSFYKYLIIAITDTTGFSIFAEKHKDNVCYKYDMINGSSTDPKRCSREDLLDEVGERRPECFDWLLFNQGWL